MCSDIYKRRCERVFCCNALSVSPCLSCLSHLLWMTEKTEDNLSVLNVCEKARERGRELSATLANHLIGCHTELTFEGYGSISPEMKKREERDEGERLDMQQACCGVGSPYQCICLSIRTTRPHLLYDLHPPQSSASSRHPSLFLSLSPSRPERREGKDRDERREKKYSQGQATGGWVNA